MVYFPTFRLYFYGKYIGKYTKSSHESVMGIHQGLKKNPASLEVKPSPPAAPPGRPRIREFFWCSDEMPQKMFRCFFFFVTRFLLPFGRYLYVVCKLSSFITFV